MPPEYRCDCHPKHERILGDHDRALEMNTSDHKDLWEAIKDRVTNRYFLILVGLVITNLGFQFAIYEKVNSVDQKTAVIETKLEDHIKSTNGVGHK